jgi:hemerythrin
VGASLQWTPTLAVGVPDIDEQHQELFRRGERLISALRAGDRSEVLPLLAYLDDYAVHHFEAEERVMREARYPGLEAQVAAHAAFRKDFAAMVRDYRRTGPTALLALTLHNWLSDWLRQHIGDLDRELGRFLAARRS